MPRTQMDKVVGAVVPLANALDAFDLSKIDLSQNYFGMPAMSNGII
jgi:hypothetical protein